ncbi:MAG TPA: aldo/keto reductase [Candidatus Mediterraneibacter pullistercoris]|nr:aldo/keto reductase [Candidatus Mediterraneibacter pullistercoris]
MITRRLGRTGYEVTAFGLGCFQFTGEYDIDPDVSEKLMDYAMESPINVFDTAQMYDFGESEEIVARGAYKHPDKKVYISTKIGYLHERTVTRAKGYEAYQDPKEIKRAVKHSLWISRRDSLDMCMIHEPDWDCWGFDYETGDSVILSTLEELKKEGYIANIGLGSTEYTKSAKLIDTGRIDCALVAGGISLIARPIFDKLIPAAKRNDCGIIAGAGFGMGNKFLTAKRRDELPELLESGDEVRVNTGKKLEKIYDLSDELGMDMFEMAVRYILAFDDIHTHCAGAREIAHIRTNLGYAEKGPLPADVVEKINAIQDEFVIHQDYNMMGLFGKPPGFLSD